ncbi:iron ABC transporter permease, partial [Bacillus sp. mrc49]
MKSYKSFRLFNEKISFLMDKKAMIIVFILFLVTSSVFVLSTGLGEMNIH